MIKTILTALTFGVDRRSRCNALGYDERDRLAAVTATAGRGAPESTAPELSPTQSSSPLPGPTPSPALAADAGETPGEVRSDPLTLPSPGDLADSALFLVAAETISGLCYLLAGGTHSLDDLVVELRARSEQFAIFESINT
ncbi:hypothetical protein [Mycolicibacterium porcinum]|uniref:Uncharacterized protein n=1 Tax=Mycolicibacterium porcinum TaxID=39693 RepID=A0ABV3VI45_9MYCO